jgi:hypothetical protein
LYWDLTPELRRQKLMAFFWNTIARQGQIYGNRLYQNKMNVSNIYKISYPGYNEMLTGCPDPIFIPTYPYATRIRMSSNHRGRNEKQATIVSEANRIHDGKNSGNIHFYNLPESQLYYFKNHHFHFTGRQLQLCLTKDNYVLQKKFVFRH